MINIKVILIFIIIIICILSECISFETFRINFDLKKIPPLRHPANLTVKLPTNIISAIDLSKMNTAYHDTTTNSIIFKDDNINIIYKVNFEYNPYIREYLYYNVYLFIHKYANYYKIKVGSDEDMRRAGEKWGHTYTMSEEFIGKLNTFLRIYEYIIDSVWPTLFDTSFNDEIYYSGNDLIPREIDASLETGQAAQIQFTGMRDINEIDDAKTNYTIQNLDQFNVLVTSQDLEDYLI